jgi:hypothetical protein
VNLDCWQFTNYYNVEYIQPHQFRPSTGQHGYSEGVAAEPSVHPHPLQSVPVYSEGWEEYYGIQVEWADYYRFVNRVRKAFDGIRVMEVINLLED